MRSIFLLLMLTVMITEVNAQNLSSPESMVYDERGKRYIVTNAANGKTGGNIVFYYPATREYENFVVEGINSPKGVVIFNNIAFITDVNMVKGFSLETSELVFTMIVPGATFLNDITNDGAILYISDSAGNKLYKISIPDKDVSLLCDDKCLSRPNGIYYDKESNRLIICSYRANTTIQEFDLNMHMLSSIVSTSLSQLDGVARDKDGNYYFSSWASNAVYRFDPEFKEEPVEVSNGHFGPADIFINQEAEILAIPNFLSNEIDLIDIGEKSIEDEMNPFAIKIYPNPATTHFSIELLLEKESMLEISLMSKSGRVMKQLKKDEMEAGVFSVKIEMGSLGIEKGIYFIKFVIDESVFMKRIIVLD